MNRLLLLVAFALGGCSGPAAKPVVADPNPPAKPVVRVGSKKFTESVVLAKMGALLAELGGADGRQVDLGATPALWLALTQGDIAAYPEYTGTITQQILKSEPPDLAAALAPYGVRISKTLGFRNNYALGMRKDVAASLGIKTLSDLRSHPYLKFGFIHEFLDRPDGWPGVKKHYRLPQEDVQGMNHTLAYRALVEKAIDLTELYTTDGEIAQYDLLVLEDDLRFFPAYEAVWLYRAELEEKHPEIVKQLKRLEGKISEADMQRMNSQVQVDKANERRVAGEFLNRSLRVPLGTDEDTLSRRVLRTTWEHLLLVVPSLFAAILIAIPLGIVAARRPLLGRGILAVSGILQTIPSLALLLFMIPVMKFLVDEGTGMAPAVAALFLYSLLPIVRNTHTGMTTIPPPLMESAEALGLSRRAILWRIELPLAMPVILAGIRTAAVINVGTATLGGFIGAGGYGTPILRGLDKFDVPLMLEGAIPAAIMAMAAEGIFGLIERGTTRHTG